VASHPEYVIEKLSKTHELGSFDCGKEPLNLWLERFAWTNVQNDSVRVYVAHRRDNVVCGYHAITVGGISREDAPERIAKGLAAHPVGVAVIGRLAVDTSQQGKGLGVTLLQDALRRIETAADEIGIRAVLVQAIDAQARQFYLKFGFSPSLIDDMRLMLLMKDLRAFLRSSRAG
jgi:GNAT superfamily N-acetyltransferase